MRITSLCFIYLCSLLANASPCHQINPYGPGIDKTPLEYLESDVNVVRGTARIFAECEMVANPQITVCLAAANSNYRNGMYYILSILTPAKVKLYSHSQFISSTDEGSRVQEDGSFLKIKNSFHNDGWGKGGPGGHVSLIELDRWSKTLRYQYWSSNSWSKWWPDWKQELDFQFENCKTPESNRIF